jgi:serine/threonine protein kinase
VSHVNKSAVHCINPDCQSPYPQPWGNKFCNGCGAPLQLLYRYIPLQRLGSGGFAQIYTVWDELAQTEQVLKVLVENSPKALELFAQEAEVLKTLRHPGVPRVEADAYFLLNLSHPKQRQLPCLVMEKIHGETLEEIQKKYPQGCPQELVLNWLSQIVDILQDLHQRNIIHRDIKPSNLMLRSPYQGGTKGEQLVLIDFGGAKQFSAASTNTHSSSTRLFSSGYSPPEQIRGRNVEPVADFYALGRTMIELLTGKYPPNLEEPLTGELRWRTIIDINPEFADLLDEMVQDSARSRPANATIIQRRLTQISSLNQRPSLFAKIPETIRQAFASFAPPNPPTISNPKPAFLPQLQQEVRQLVTGTTRSISNTIVFILKAIAKTALACLDTVWTMILTGFGACFGTVAGFILAYRTSWGDRVAEFVSKQLPEVIPNTQTGLGSEIILFAAAGLGTALGLTLAGGFGQKRRYLVASVTGIVGYGLGWLVLQFLTATNGEGLVGLILTAISLLTLSLGLRSHHLVYAAIAAFGTAVVFTGLINLGFPSTLFEFSSQPSWGDLALPLTFFILLGVFVSFWLGVSHYIIVPGLRFLGWR